MLDSITTLIHSSSFYEFAVLLTLACIGGLISTLIRQPLIIAFIVIGVIAGPSMLNITTASEEITLLAKLGIAILLFIVGLKLDLKLVKNLGVTAAVIAIGQMSLTIIGAMGVTMALGFDPKSSLLIGIALSFSSTIIIVKILSDKREIDSMHGRIALGVLIIQDLAVVISMIILATMSNPASNAQSEASLINALIEVTLYSIGLLIIIGLFMRFAALHTITYVARHKELLLVFSIAWAILLAAVCDMMGLSKELGGLLAGISLASTPFREAIISRLASLRDFLLLFFFIALGLQLDLEAIEGMLMPAIVLSIFVLLFKPISIMIFSALLGYRKRTGFLAGLALGQISEFSLIFITMTYSLGFIEQQTFGLVTMVALISITISTYMLSQSQWIYSIFEPVLGIFERKIKHREEEYDSTNTRRSYDVIIFGLGRYGQAMAEGFEKAGKSVLAVDFNPEEIKNWKKKGGKAVFGDASDPEFFHNLPLKKASWVISALPRHGLDFLHEDPRLVILHALKDNQYEGRIAIACHHKESAEYFAKRGIDLIFLPYHDAAERAVNLTLECS